MYKQVHKGLPSNIGSFTEKLSGRDSEMGGLPCGEATESLSCAGCFPSLEPSSRLQTPATAMHQDRHQYRHQYRVTLPTGSKQTQSRDGHSGLHLTTEEAASERSLEARKEGVSPGYSPSELRGI